MNDEMNQILDWVDSVGGGSVWEDGINAVIISDRKISRSEMCRLMKLKGMKQLALIGERQDLDTLKLAACLNNLRSLVISRKFYSAIELNDLADSLPNKRLDMDED